MGVLVALLGAGTQEEAPSEGSLATQQVLGCKQEACRPEASLLVAHPCPYRLEEASEERLQEVASFHLGEEHRLRLASRELRSPSGLAAGHTEARDRLDLQRLQGEGCLF